MRHRACLGDGANAYSLGKITIREDATVAQEAYLCTGSHAFDQPSQNLIVAEIDIGEKSFIAARAFILPGVHVGRGAIVGACAVVTRDVPDYCTVVGNPAHRLDKKRELPLCS